MCIVEGIVNKYINAYVNKIRVCCMRMHFQTYQWSYFVVTILNVKLSNNAPVIRASCRAWQCVFHLWSLVTA
jgi:hypothetical protein